MSSNYYRVSMRLYGRLEDENGNGDMVFVDVPIEGTVGPFDAVFAKMAELRTKDPETQYIVEPL